MNPRCFAAKCEREFDSFEDMVAVPGAGDQSPRHFCEPCSERIRRGPPLTDGGQSMDDTGRTADEWEQYLEEHPDEVLLFVDADYEIHTFEHDQQDDELCLLRGGRFGYDYEGSRASLEAFAEDDSDAHKLVPRDEEHAERERLTSGEFDTPQEWVECEPQSATENGGDSA